MLMRTINEYRKAVDLKIIAITLFALLLNICSSLPARSECPGDTTVPPEYAGFFEAVEDTVLLNSALGVPDKGSLCQGKVYLVKTNVSLTIFRAWNSTNPNSRLGNWWAFDKPAGKTAQFRADYEVCYQWSPLDKLTECRLQAGTKIVVGTGQSAQCSTYLTYPTSSTKQIYISDASTAVARCGDFDLLFSWKPVNATK